LPKGKGENNTGKKVVYYDKRTEEQFVYDKKLADQADQLVKTGDLEQVVKAIGIYKQLLTQLGAQLRRQGINSPER